MRDLRSQHSSERSALVLIGIIDAEKCIRLVCKLTVFPVHGIVGIPLNSASNSLSYDIVRFKIEVGVEEKFMCKNVSKQTQHAHCDSSDNAAMRGGHILAST